MGDININKIGQQPFVPEDMPKQSKKRKREQSNIPTPPPPPVARSKTSSRIRFKSIRLDDSNAMKAIAEKKHAILKNPTRMMEKLAHLDSQVEKKRARDFGLGGVVESPKSTEAASTQAPTSMELDQPKSVEINKLAPQAPAKKSNSQEADEDQKTHDKQQAEIRYREEGKRRFSMEREKRKIAEHDFQVKENQKKKLREK